MKMPKVWDGKQWRVSTKEEYENVIINVPVYGKANWIFPNVWELPKVDTNVMTGSKVVKCGRSVQFRFSCARSTETAQAVRAYKIALDKDARSGVRFNYTKSGNVFIFETTFCGSLSALKKFEGFVKKLSSMTSIKSILVRMRQEKTDEVSNFKKFEYNSNFLSIVGYLRDSLAIEDYNKIKISNLEIVPYDNIYGLIVTFKK